MDVFQEYHPGKDLDQILCNRYCFNPKGNIYFQFHNVNEERQFIETQPRDNRENKCPEITECLDKTPS